MSGRVYELARTGDLASLKKLVKKSGREILLGKDESFDQTVLHVAAERGHIEVVRWLLKPENKVPVNAIDKNGWSPLHSAAMHGESKMEKRFSLLRKKKKKKDVWTFARCCFSTARLLLLAQAREPACCTTCRVSTLLFAKTSFAKCSKRCCRFVLFCFV
jgi:ankyrin repeat protein